MQVDGEVVNKLKKYFFLKAEETNFEKYLLPHQASIIKQEVSTSNIFEKFLTENKVFWGFFLFFLSKYLSRFCYGQCMGVTERN